jgi:hypothetical protein
MYGVIIRGGLVAIGKALRAENSPRPRTEIVLPRDSAESSEQGFRMNSARGAYLLSIFGSAPGYLRHGALDGLPRDVA